MHESHLPLFKTIYFPIAPFACLYYAETMLFQRVLTSGMMYIHTFSLIRLLFLL